MGLVVGTELSREVILWGRFESGNTLEGFFPFSHAHMTRVNAWSDAVQFLLSMRRTLHDVNAVVRHPLAISHAVSRRESGLQFLSPPACPSQATNASQLSQDH